MIDIDRIRADTPAAARRAHLHNAGSALMPIPVVEAMKRHIDLEAEIGGYAAADREAERLQAVYGSVAKLLNAQPAEIALMENATIAWQMAFYAFEFQAGDRILTAEAEYAANYVAYLQVARRTGAKIEVVPSDASGELDVAALERMIDERVKLITVTWIPTNGGLVNPAAAIGRLARRHGIPYLLDACQAVGQMPVDVEAIGCDMLSATGRKFLRGPRGTGFLYVRQALLERLEPPMIDHFAAPWVARDRYELRPDARRFENWENNYAARLGLGVAVDYALAVGLEEIEARCRMLARRLRKALVAITGAKLRDLGRDPSAIVSFTLEGHGAGDVVRAADRAGITIGASDPSSTLLDSEARALPPLVRASPHYYNTESEVDRLIELCATLSATPAARQSFKYLTPTTQEKMMANRTSDAEWRGDLKSGQGKIKLGSGAFEGSYSFKSRFEEGKGTNPEELIAAAHAGCFSMAFAHALSEAGHPPTSIHTTATVQFGPVPGGFAISRIDLVTEGSVPGIDAATFDKFAAGAKENCPVSKALKAVEITLKTKFV